LDGETYRELFERTARPLCVFERESRRVLAVSDSALELLQETRESFVMLPLEAPAHLRFDTSDLELSGGRACLARITGLAEPFLSADDTTMTVAEALRQNHLHSAQTEQHTHVGSWIADFASGRVLWSDELYRIVGMPIPAPGTFAPGMIAVTEPSDAATVIATRREFLKTGERVTLDHRIVRPDGERRWVRTTAELLSDNKGAALSAVGTVVDITLQKNAEERLAFLDRYDELTGLRNRRGFTEALGDVLRDTSSGQPVYVFFLNIDGFKALNETLGHALGDRALTEVGLILRRFPELVACARVGADEFAFASTVLADDVAVQAFSERLNAALGRPLVLSEHEHFITATIGISCFPRDGSNVSELIRAADTAMHKMKESGGREHRFFAPEMHEEALKRLRLEQDLRAAIKRGEFLLHFQPIFDVRDGKIVAGEALIRWLHPEIGLVPPDDFIPIAEVTGQIIPIGEWVLREATRCCKGWQHVADDPIRVSVNISAKQLGHPAFVEQVSAALRDAGLAPHLLELEITETATMHDMDRAIDVLSILRRSGVRCSIDDFGTGQSSLSYLKRLPADVLKIDRSFIRDIDEDASDRALVEAVILVGHRLGFTIVAEGVETASQQQWLTDAGCDTLQGYHIGRPQAADAFEALLRPGGSELVPVSADQRAQARSPRTRRTSSP
jgi:diguanylate cyclase (GGDEF)-like protein/PAS domain S-box-containing protein